MMDDGRDRIFKPGNKKQIPAPVISFGGVGEAINASVHYRHPWSLIRNSSI
jgi:hypothetical protein